MITHTHTRRQSHICSDTRQPSRATCQHVESPEPQAEAIQDDNGRKGKYMQTETSTALAWHKSGKGRQGTSQSSVAELQRWIHLNCRHMFALSVPL
mmetsp:Transcript_20502/g.49938  ORF Transcript_20502/g.49938 Transcript_20502/m.49938 type:complete len:96 (-) Transcript_20502:381-668(-)